LLDGYKEIVLCLVVHLYLELVVFEVTHEDWVKIVESSLVLLEVFFLNCASQLFGCFEYLLLLISCTFIYILN